MDQILKKWAKITSGRKLLEMVINHYNGSFDIRHFYGPIFKEMKKISTRRMAFKNFRTHI